MSGVQKRIGFLSFGHWQPIPGSQVRTGRDALRYFASYRDAFNSDDPAAVARHIAAPCLLIEREMTVWATADEVLEAMTRLLTFYRESPVVRPFEGKL